MFNIVNSKDDKDKTEVEGAADKTNAPKYNTKKYKKKEYTPDQIKGLLNGYVQVSPTKWADIPI